MEFYGPADSSDANDYEVNVLLIGCCKPRNSEGSNAIIEEYEDRELQKFVRLIFDPVDIYRTRGQVLFKAGRN